MTYHYKPVFLAQSSSTVYPKIEAAYCLGASYARGQKG